MSTSPRFLPPWLRLALFLFIGMWLWAGRASAPSAQATAAWLWHGGNIVAGGVTTNTVQPDQAATIWLKVGYDGYINQARIYYTTNGTTPDGVYDSVTNGSLIAMTFDHTESDPGGTVAWWKGTIPAQTQGAQVRYKISAWHSGGGDIVYAESPTGKTLNTSATATTFGYYVSAYTTPAWVQDAVIYQVFIDRFFDGNVGNNLDCATTTGGYCVNDIFKWNGGDIAGALARLDYLQSLGVNTLWVSPVYENPVTQIGSVYDATPGEIYNYHGYEAQDFLDVEDNFGTTADFQSLVNAAHAAGMKVILDFVPNHSSNQHPYFQDASDNCTTSPYFRWYKFGSVDSQGKLVSYNDSLCVTGHNQWWGDNDTYANFFGVKEMPQLDNDYGPARQATIDQALTWVNTYGVDGLRLDYAPGPSHSFWMAFRAAVKAADPDIFLVGEVWTDGGAGERKSYEGELDGVLAFDHLYIFENFFAYRSTNVDTFDADLAYYEGYYNSSYVLPSFLDNHDTDRFLFRAGQNTGRLKLALIAQMTLPDPPVIYYGTEVGLSQSEANAGKPERSRSRMPWSGYLSTPPAGWDATQNSDVRNLVDTLIDLRLSISALRTGERVALYRHNTDGTYAYRRTDASSSVVVALNNSDASRTLVIPNLPGASLTWANGTVVEDQLTGQTYTVTNGQVTLNLSANQGVVLTPAATAPPIPVTFTVNGYVTQYGEDMYVVGSAPELGSWDPAAAVRLNWIDSDTWSGPADFTVSQGTTIEYKYIVRNGGTTLWESGVNRSCAIPTSGVAAATGAWSQTPGTPCVTTLGWLSPSAQAAVTSSAGDNNGYQTNPANAYADDGVYAVDTNSGSGTSTSCTSTAKDKHLYYNYAFAVPAGSTINGIEVRLNGKVDSTAGSPKWCIQLSWNGGASWTTAKSTSTLTTAEASYTLGSATDTWGRAWAAGDFSDANLRLRIIMVAGSTLRDFSLDWLAVQVHYQ